MMMKPPMSRISTARLVQPGIGFEEEDASDEPAASSPPASATSEAEVDDPAQQDRRLEEEPRRSRDLDQLPNGVRARPGYSARRARSRSRPRSKPEPVEDQQVVPIPVANVEERVDDLPRDHAERAVLGRPCPCRMKTFIRRKYARAGEAARTRTAPARRASGEDDVVALGRLVEQPRNLLGRILEVAVHDDCPPPPALREPGGDGCVLTEVAAQADRADAGVAPARPARIGQESSGLRSSTKTISKDSTIGSMSEPAARRASGGIPRTRTRE